MTDMTQVPAPTSDLPLIEKIRLSRQAALASLQAQRMPGGNVVSLEDRRDLRRQARPVFHSRRGATATKPTRLILTNPVAA